jgi:serine/threonine-protein kinase
MAGGYALDFESLRPGTNLGPFDLVMQIGAGGMARVWAARVRKTGQVVALKMLLPELAENPSFQQMFFDEARIASRIHHPNVCETYELGQYDGIWCLVMEWVDGPSLMRILRPGESDDAPKIPIHPRVAARIVAEMGSGLHAAHDTLGDDGRPLNVVHRDVSPHNVLVTSDGLIKMTDFGVAKALGKSNVTMAGQIKGKLAYMAPEQLMGGGIDRRADVFALGCVLYELTTGQRPFQGEHDPQVMTAIVLGRYELPSSLLPGYPPELEDIIVTALGNEPDQRYPTADHMRYALESWLQASGPPVMQGQIVALLRERCADDLEQRRRAMQSQNQSPPAPRRAVETGSGGAITMDRQGDRDDRRPIAALAMAAIFGAAAGVAILVYVHAHRKPHAIAVKPTPTTQPTPAVSTAAPAIELGSPSAVQPTGMIPIGTMGALTKNPVHVHVDPPAATIIIDGVQLPPGTDTIPRPEDGGSLNVLFRAEKHDDTIVIVDSATPDTLEIALLPTMVVKRPRILNPEAGAKPPASASATSSAAPEAPPNPYE